MIEDLKAFCITYILTLWVALFSAYSKIMTNWKPKTHNLKLYIFSWNFKATELLFTYIYHSFASLSVLFKLKSLIAVNLTLLLIHVSIFSSESLYILPRSQTPVLKVRVLWCKTSIYCWNLSETLSSIYEDLLPIPLFCNLKYISTFSSWFPLELAIYFEFDPRYFGPFAKFKDTKEISM